jgi:hypothetical protein
MPEKQIAVADSYFMRLARECRTRKRQGPQQMRPLARILRGRCGHDLGVVALLIGYPNDACRYTLVWSLKNWNRLKCLKDLSTKRFTGVQNISANILEKERPRPLQALSRRLRCSIFLRAGDIEMYRGSAP